MNAKAMLPRATTAVATPFDPAPLVVCWAGAELSVEVADVLALLEASDDDEAAADSEALAEEDALESESSLDAVLVGEELDIIDATVVEGAAPLEVEATAAAVCCTCLTLWKEVGARV